MMDDATMEGFNKAKVAGHEAVVEYVETHDMGPIWDQLDKITLPPERRRYIIHRVVGTNERDLLLVRPALSDAAWTASELTAFFKSHEGMPYPLEFTVETLYDGPTYTA